MASVICSVIATAVFIKPIMDKVFDDLTAMAERLAHHLDRQ